jgi:hypothetical protein
LAAEKPELKNKMNKIIALVIGLALLGFTAAEAQTTNLTFPQTGYAPYFSPSNVVSTGSQAMINNDPVLVTTGTLILTNDYTFGTNYNGNQAYYPSAIASSLNVAFGLTVTTTNVANKGTYTAYIQGGTGWGDWTTIATLPVNTSLYAASDGGLGFQFSTNVTVSVGGYKYFRVFKVTNGGESNYTAQVLVSMSAKAGAGI